MLSNGHEKLIAQRPVHSHALLRIDKTSFQRRGGFQLRWACSVS